MQQPLEYQRLLTPEQEIELARRVHGSDAADAIAARDELVLHNVRLAYQVAGRMAQTWPRIEHDDLLSEAMVALVQVAERYDPDTHHTRFSTYAIPDITGRLLNFARQKRCRGADTRPELINQVDPAPAPLERIISAEELNVAITALAKLAPLKAYVIARRFGIGVEVSSLRDIASDIGCSYEYVRQLEHRAISQLSRKNRI